MLKDILVDQSIIALSRSRLLQHDFANGRLVARLVENGRDAIYTRLARCSIRHWILLVFQHLLLFIGSLFDRLATTTGATRCSVVCQQQE